MKKYTHVLIILALLFGLLAVTSYFLPFRNMKEEESIVEKRADELDMLTQSSEPVTATPAERGAELQNLKGQHPKGVSFEDRARELESLSQ